jgi:excisionase family DNA binding protein
MNGGRLQTSISRPETSDGGEAVRAAAEALVQALIVATRSQSAPLPKPERLLSIDETATMLGIGRSAVYEAISRGELSSLKIGRRRLVSTGAVTRFVEDLAGLDPTSRRRARGWS